MSSQQGMESPSKNYSYLERLGFGRLHVQGLDRMRGDGLAKGESLKDLVAENFVLILCGDRGRGKTQISTYLAAQIEVNRSSIGWEHKTHARAPRYFCAHDLMQAIRGEFSDIKEQCQQSIRTLAQASGCSLLVIDEFSELTGSDYNKRTLTNLIDRRYRAMLPTIIISNTDPKNIAGEVGRSTYDRASESGGIVECNWTSYRR